MGVFRCARVVDGTGSDPLDNAEIVVTGDFIHSVQGASSAKSSDTIDLEDLTILPGLIDAHTHLAWLNLNGASSPALMAAQIFENCELAIQSGFTTIRDVGGVDGGVVEAVASGLVRGPRILPSGPILCQTGGHGDLSSSHVDCDLSPSIPGLAHFSAQCDGPEEVRAAARRAFKRGATQIKMCISGGVVSHSDNVEDTQFTPREIRAAVEEAGSRGAYVTAHAHNAAAMRMGVEAGVACLEHGTYLDEETARLMAAHGVAMVPTLSVVHLGPQKHREWAIDEELLPRFDGVEEAMGAATKLAVSHGILVGSGSDLLGPSQSRRGLELLLKSRVLDPMSAIVSATFSNAQILRRGDLGAILPGRRADFIAIDGDPLTNPELFDDASKIVLVVKDGHVVKDTR